MRVLIAPNAFKGCLSAEKAARAMAEGARRAVPRARVDVMPVSDGGDGLMEVLLGRFGGRRVHRRVTGPLGEPRRACYAVLNDGETAVIEMARASGIAGLARGRLDPLGATSFGTGQLIRAALEFRRKGGVPLRRIIVGLGGSATSDGGAGMAEALGARFYDARGQLLPRGAAALERLERVDVSGFVAPRGARVIAVSDVVNPLLGPSGSARVYGPQKGATAAMVRRLERALRRYARALRRDLGADVSRIPGGGAAGGLGAGLAAFLKARIVPGADWVLDALDADRRSSSADLLLTGEGRLDESSFYGKAPVALARRAGGRGVAVRFICGQIAEGIASRLGKRGWRPAYSLAAPGEDPAAAMRGARERLRRAAERAVLEFAAGALLAAAAGGFCRGVAAAENDAAAPRVQAEAVDTADDLYFHRNIGDNLGKSQAILRDLLGREPGSPRALWRLGRGRVREGERRDDRKERIALFKRAEKELRRSLELDPGNAEAHFFLGLAYGRRGQAQGMLHSLFLVGPIREEMKKTLALEPRHGGAHHVLGEMYRELPGFAGGSKKRAVEEMERAVALSPKHTANYTDAAQAYLDDGQRDKAIAVLKQGLGVTEPADPAEFEEDLKAMRAMLDGLERGK